MKEIILLNFGNFSNYISTHFWNLNDEVLKLEDRFNLNQNLIYNDYDYPRNLIYDFSENIRPYYIQNENIDEEKLNEVEEDILSFMPNTKISKYYNLYNKNKNNFLDILEEINNELGLEEEENKEKLDFDKNQDYDEDDEYYNINSKQNMKNNKNFGLDFNSHINIDDHYYNYSIPKIKEKENSENKKRQMQKQKQKQKISNLEEILKMPDQQFYDYLNFKKTIKNWNDYSQAKFSKNSFNDIKMLDVDINCRSSYLKGFEFFENDNFSHSYLEKFEDNFRKFLEDCDRLELMNINCDFNSFWGGLCNRLIESYDDETPKITKVIFGSDIHSSFLKKCELNDNENKVRDYKIDLNSVLDFNPKSNIQNNIDLKNDNDNFIEDFEKLINYLWYFTDLQSNRRNILFHPVLRGMNPKIIKESFNYSYESFNSEDPVYNFFFSSICGANLQNLLIPLRSKFCGNSNYLNNVAYGNNSLNFFESTINFSLENPVKLGFPKLFGDKQFSNNGVIFNINRNTNTVYWPMFYDNLEKNKKKNFTIIHGFKEDYRFLDEKIENYFRKTSDFNYTCLDGFNLPFCYPRKFYFKKSYFYYDNNEDKNTTNMLNKNDLLNQTQSKLIEKNKNFNVSDIEFKEIFLNKLNISSTFSNFNDYTKKFIHVVPKLLKKNEQRVKQYLNNFDMGKFIEYREKMEEYYEFLDFYKQHDFYGGLGIGESDDDYELENRLNDERDEYDY